MCFLNPNCKTNSFVSTNVLGKVFNPSQSRIFLFVLFRVSSRLQRYYVTQLWYEVYLSLHYKLHLSVITGND